MATQDVIVVGASTGGLEALRAVVGGLPADLPAAVFVVQHIGRGLDGRSMLPDILNKSGPMPAWHPADGDPIKNGQIYVAPPDFHMLIGSAHIHLSRGPKENRTRPAINPLFRSAAASYGARVAGVILTGMLDDGIAGLAEIKRQGGVAIVQDPSTAVSPDMPAEAIRNVDVDYIAPLSGIPAILSHLAATDRTVKTIEEPMERTLADLTCPECRGPLWEESQGRIREYRCRVGHAYSPLALFQEHRDTVERTLWSAIVALEEAAKISDVLAPELGQSGGGERHRNRAATIEDMLTTSCDDEESAEQARQARSQSTISTE